MVPVWHERQQYVKMMRALEVRAGVKAGVRARVRAGGVGVGGAGAGALSTALHHISRHLTPVCQ